MQSSIYRLEKHHVIKKKINTKLNLQLRRKWREWKTSIIIKGDEVMRGDVRDETFIINFITDKEVFVIFI
jgi:hypothetical protein